MRESLEKIVRRLVPEGEIAPDPARFGAMLENLCAATGSFAAFLCVPHAPGAPALPCAVFPPDETERVRGLLPSITAIKPEARRGVTVTTLPDGSVSAYAAALRREHVSACLTVALVDAQGTSCGVLGLLTGEPDALGRPTLAVLEAFGAQIVAEIERARATAQLERERAYFEQALETASDGIVILDGDDRIVDVNRCFTQIFGYDAEEVRGRPINDVIVPEETHEEASRLSRESLEGRVVHAEVERRRKDGSLVPLSLLAYPVLLHGRQVGVLAVYHDITNRRRAEAALRASEEKYRTLFETSKDVIYISSPEGRLLDVNTAGVELFEYESREAMLAANIQSDFYVDPRDRERLVRALERKGFVTDFETVLKTRTGRRIIVQDNCTAEKDAHGRLIRYRGFLHDVTERRMLEGQLRHSQKMEAVGRIAGGVAHDFNNLLMGVEGFASLLGVHFPEGSQGRADVEEIRRLARLGGQLTRKLLAFSRQQVLSLETVDVNALIEETAGFLTRVLGENVVQERRLDPDLWPVHADAGQLEQVLVNLALNARDAMPLGGTLTTQTERVTVADEREGATLGVTPGDYVRLTVRDTGIGMTAEVRERVFEPFFTTKELGKGSGLGLSIVYGIVKQCGGAVHVASEPGHGATFTIFLPRDEAAEPKHAGDTGRVAVTNGSGTVLIAEDELTVRLGLRRYLEDRGYTVLDAADGRAALDLARAHRGPLDVLVADIAMPGMRGNELAGELRRERPGLHVIFMSGYLELGDGESLMLGAPVLEKPFSPDALARKIAEILRAD